MEKIQLIGFLDLNLIQKWKIYRNRLLFLIVVLSVGCVKKTPIDSEVYEEVALGVVDSLYNKCESNYEFTWLGIWMGPQDPAAYRVDRYLRTISDNSKISLLRKYQQECLSKPIYSLDTLKSDRFVIVFDSTETMKRLSKDTTKIFALLSLSKITYDSAYNNGCFYLAVNRREATPCGAGGFLVFFERREEKWMKTDIVQLWK